ncbi:pentapeptide repeat-containing protein [Amycolatopsis japonica]|uniref:pentapeptide repeat-containing protein n=1 Tax=Amycolatopsis japonica TaxID=208439 RepID=UPI00366FA62C
MTDDPRPPTATCPPSPTTSPVRRLPELTQKAMWTTALVIAVLTAAAVTVLWWPATAGLTGADLVKARLDALKIGLSIGVGSGGVVALYLAWRRQHSTEADLDNRDRTLAHQERAADDVRADATERRITELYTKAVEQLGSDKAPVRLGGLYALERLAQDNETQRQTIVNVLCAYLRMPYEIPEPPADDADAEHREQHRALVQEREVRLTAQRILADHLQPDRVTAYWGELDLDLTGAQLIDFALAEARLGTTTFRNATFNGKTTFVKTTFTDCIDFKRATFSESVEFDASTFCKDAPFQEANFNSLAWFDQAKFHRDALFQSAIFATDARFYEAKFSGDAWFRAVSVGGEVRFDGATFADEVIFERANIIDRVVFENAKFASIPLFIGGSVGGETIFDEATLNGEPISSAALPGQDAARGPRDDEEA